MAGQHGRASTTGAIHVTSATSRPAATDDGMCQAVVRRQIGCIFAKFESYGQGGGLVRRPTRAFRMIWCIRFGKGSACGRRLCQQQCRRERALRRHESLGRSGAVLHEWGATVGFRRTGAALGPEFVGIPGSGPHRGESSFEWVPAIDHGPDHHAKGRIHPGVGRLLRMRSGKGRNRCPRCACGFCRSG